MTRSLPIIMAQVAPVEWDPAATLEAYEAYVAHVRAVAPSTHLVIHPELHLTGLGRIDQRAPAGWSPSAIAQPIPGPLSDRVGALARRLGLWLVPGSIYELGGDGRVYNTAIAVAPDGSIRARYRKIFPWRPYELVAAGDEFVVLELDGVGIAGLMICSDGWFPEVARQLAWLGAELILQPTATGTIDRSQEIVLAQANAIVNQVFVANVNAAGEAGRGQSALIDPEGRPIHVGGGGREMITAVLDLDHVARAREVGTAGLNRLWSQIDQEGGRVTLPMYGGRIRPRAAADEARKKDPA